MNEPKIGEVYESISNDPFNTKVHIYEVVDIKDEHALVENINGDGHQFATRINSNFHNSFKKLDKKRGDFTSEESTTGDTEVKSSSAFGKVVGSVLVAATISAFAWNYDGEVVSSLDLERYLAQENFVEDAVVTIESEGDETESNDDEPVVVVDEPVEIIPVDKPKQVAEKAIKHDVNGRAINNSKANKSMYYNKSRNEMVKKVNPVIKRWEKELI